MNRPVLSSSYTGDNTDNYPVQHAALLRIHGEDATCLYCGEKKKENENLEAFAKAHEKCAESKK